MISLVQQFWVNVILILSCLTTVIRYRGRTPRPEEVRGVLVFQLTELGDVVLATDVMRRIRDRYPQARITLACGPWAQPMMEGQPFVDEVFVYQSNITMTAKHAKLSVGEHWRLVQQMAKLPVDLLVDLRGNLGSIVTAWLSSARYRVDRGSQRWNDLLKRRDVWHRHETELNLEIVAPLGIQPQPPRVSLVPTADVRESVERTLLKAGFDCGAPFVVIHPGASWIAKRWREERFAALADLIQLETGCQVVLTGTQSEKPVGQKIIAAMQTTPINLMGLLSIREILVLYANAALWIGNDTGTMHVAVALNRPVIVLWGPTNLKKFGPCGTNALAIVGQGSSKADKNPRCKMDLIQVPEVWKAVQKKLKKEESYVNA